MSDVYDPQLGVFLSVDPVTAYDDPVLYSHRYRHAGNNPYKFTDPDGRCYLFCQPPGTYNPHSPILGAERGDAQVVGLVAGSAVAGSLCAVGDCAAVAAGGRAIIASGEAASLKAGMAAQHATNTTSNALAVTTKATAVAATNVTARVAVAVEGEASMVATYAGASTSKANAIGASAAATSAAIAEFAAGVVTGAPGIKIPASSASNMAVDLAGSVLNTKLKNAKVISRYGEKCITLALLFFF